MAAPDAEEFMPLCQTHGDVTYTRTCLWSPFPGWTHGRRGEAPREKNGVIPPRPTKDCQQSPLLRGDHLDQ